MTFEIDRRAMGKWRSRLVMIFLIAGYGFVAICQYTGLGERVLQARDSSVPVKIVLPAFALLLVLSLVGGWGLMLYNWSKRAFKTSSHRRLWFLAMTLGMMVGVLVYYVIVFEMDLTAEENGET